MGMRVKVCAKWTGAGTHAGRRVPLLRRSSAFQGTLTLPAVSGRTRSNAAALGFGRRWTIPVLAAGLGWACVFGSHRAEASDPVGATTAAPVAETAPVATAPAATAPVVLTPAETPAENKELADADALAEAMWANAACFVCHVSLVKEELTVQHAKVKIPCIKCHGLSAPHANDEYIGATPPDVVFPREKIDAMCLECHKTHDAPAKAVVARFVSRRLSLPPAAVCTQCHGTHKIEESAKLRMKVEG